MRDDTKNGHEEAKVTYTRLFAYLNDLIWISKSIGSRKVSPTRIERKIGTPSTTWKERNKTTPSGTRKPQKGAASGHTRQPELDFFAFLGTGFAQIFEQTDSIRQKKLSSTHFVASRNMMGSCICRMEKVSLPVKRVQVSFCGTKTKYATQ